MSLRPGPEGIVYGHMSLLPASAHCGVHLSLDTRDLRQALSITLGQWLTLAGWSRSE